MWRRRYKREGAQGHQPRQPRMCLPPGSRGPRRDCPALRSNNPHGGPHTSRGVAERQGSFLANKPIPTRHFFTRKHEGTERSREHEGGLGRQFIPRGASSGIDPTARGPASLTHSGPRTQPPLSRRRSCAWVQQASSFGTHPHPHPQKALGRGLGL